MRKIITLLTMLALCVCTGWSLDAKRNVEAFRASGLRVESGKLNRSTLQGIGSMKKVQTPGFPGSPGEKVLAVKKVKGNDGKEWTVEFLASGGRWFYYGDRTEWYFVICRAYTSIDGEDYNDLYQLPLFWPQNSLIGKNGNGIPSATELANAEEAIKEFRMTTDPIGIQDSWGIYPWLGEDGNEYYAIINGTPCNALEIYDLDNPTTLQLAPSANGSDLSFELNINLSPERDWTGDGTHNINIKYDGEEKSQGMKEDDFPNLWVIGAMQYWDINSSGYYLSKTGEKIYSGKFWVAPERFAFRLYGRLGDWESWSMGAADEDGTGIPVELDSEYTYTGPIFRGGNGDSRGKGNWTYENWPGGTVEITADLNTNTITMQALPISREEMSCYLSYDGVCRWVPMELTGDGIFHAITDVTPSDAIELSMEFPSGLKLGLSENVYVGERGATRGMTIGEGGKILEYDSDKLEITIDLNNYQVRLFNPNSTFNPADYVITFPDETQTELYTWRKNRVYVQEPEGLDEWIELDAEGSLGEGTDDNGRYIDLRPHNEGEEVTVTATTESLRNAGISYSKTFMIVEEDLLTGASDKMYATGSITGFDTASTECVLEQTEPGVYIGIISPSDSKLAIRFTLPYADGKTVSFGPQGNWNSYQFGEKEIHGQYEELTNSAGFASLNLYTNDNEEYYIFRDNMDKNFRVKVDLNSHSLILMPADFTPEFTVDQTEMTVRPWKNFYIVINSNLSDIVGIWDEHVTIDNPDVAGLNWSESTESGWILHIGTGEEGECNITINAPWMETFGIEPITVHVTVKDVKPTNISVDKPQLTIREGEFDRIEYFTEPYDNYGAGISMVPELLQFQVEWYNKNYVYILGLTAGEYSFDLVCWDDENIRVTVPVTVLPKDASLAEHIVYTAMDPESSTNLSLDSHPDGCEATTSWSSSNPEVAEVSADGVVLAKKAGKTVITANCGKHVTMTGIHVMGTTEAEAPEAENIIVYGQNETVVVCGLSEGNAANVYSADGTLMATRKSDGTALRIPVGAKGAFVVTAAGKSFKVML